MENFKDAPLSISEARAARSEDVRDLAPRDTLVQLLREVDRGHINMETCVVVFTHRESCTEDTFMVGVRRSKAGLCETLGLIEAAKFDLLHDTTSE